jgi:homoserine O-acetyltransferase/O-succinyltransferase
LDDHLSEPIKEKMLMLPTPSCLLRALVATALLAAATPAVALDELVEKQVFELDEFTTIGGETIRDVRIGWEAYGELNAARDNAILITHFFSGNSNAAGRYTEDAAPGWWDAIIGPGKPIDTDRFYVIASDTLVNLGTGLPDVVTTGPATINPETDEPYGMDFPVVTIRDFVEVQRHLIDDLGIEQLHAVMGPSMGALQVFEWASAYPDRVGRAVPVIGSGWADGNLIAWLNVWSAPIRLDPNWNEGDYYDGEPPLRGLSEALKIVTLQSNHWKWANRSFGRAWAEEDADPMDSFDNRFAIEAVLDAAGAARAATSDANHFLYLAKANQLFFAGHEETHYQGLMAIEAPVLMIYSEDDQVFNKEAVRDTAAIIRSGGAEVELLEITGGRGHLDGLLFIGHAGERIRAFLEGE